MIGSFQQFSTPSRKGKDSIAAVRVGEPEGSEPPTLLFDFSRAGDRIDSTDKEVGFGVRIGPMQIQVKYAR